MSRSTIFGVVGAVVGFVVTGYNPAGAQWGFMIGSGIGALTDNTKTYGPRASDAAQQASQDGTFRTYGYGEFPTTGIILWRDERKEHKKKQGKGGPKNFSYTYTWSYAVGICKGPIGGILIVKRNGTIVFDARTNAELALLGYTERQISEQRAAQAKFLEKAKFYFGDFEQLGDPTIQAVKGIDNTPTYRGRAYIVLTDDDVTNDGAAIPQYEFVVAQCGEDVDGNIASGQILITGNGSVEPLTPFITAAATEVLELVGISTSTGADVQGAACSVNDAGMFIAVGEDELLYSLDITSAWFSVETAFPVRAGRFGVYGPDGWLLQYADDSHAGSLAKAGAVPTDVSPVTIDLAGTLRSTLSWINVVDGEYYGSLGFAGDILWRNTNIDTDAWTLVTTEATSISTGTDSVRFFYDIEKFEGELYATCYTASDYGGLGGGDTLRKSNLLGAVWDTLIVDGRDGAVSPFQLCNRYGKLLVVNRDCSLVWTSADNFSVAHSTGVYRTPADFPRNEKDGRVIAPAGGRFYIIGDAGVVSTLDGITFSDVAAYPPGFSNPRAIAGSDGAQTPPTGSDVPDAGDWKYDRELGFNGGSYRVVRQCTPMLDEIVIDQCAIRNVTRVIAEELKNDEVRGFRIATQTSPKDNIRALQGLYFFDANDSDGYIRFIKRPQPDTFSIVPDDLVANDNGPPIEWEITKENDLLRKVTLSYFDPATNYTQTTQQHERLITIIKAQGEGVFESALTADKDFSKQNCEKSVKVAWAERQSGKLRVRLNHAARTPGDWGTLTELDGTVHTIRIVRVEVDSVQRVITFRKTRRSAYTSSATGIGSPLPAPPDSGIRGLTDSMLMNAPALNSDFDKPGILWAPAGITPSWNGAVLQIQRGTTWTSVANSEDACAVGTLLAELPAFDGTLDNENTLSVELNEDFENITFADMMAGGNPYGIINPDGTIELIQAQNGTQFEDGKWNLTTIIRGRKDTANVSHAAGSRIVKLDERMRFVQVRADDLGKTLTFRAVSLGTDPDAAPTQTITLTTMESQREWQPWNITVTKDASCQWLIEFIGRPRLGTDLNPIQSQWFTGWRIDFTVDGVTKSRVTQEESFLYTTAMQEQDWGAVRCAPYQVSVTATNAYTGGDGAGGAGSGGLPTAADLSEPFAVSGTFPDGYVGVPYILRNGDMGLVATGGFWDGTAYGEIAPGVGAFGDAPLGSTYLSLGIPYAAGTYAASLEFSATSPIAGHAGSGTIANSVTIAAKPSYSTIDMRLRINQRDKLVDTTPPWTTFELTGGQLYSYGFASGKCRGEFTLTGNTGVVTIGVNVDMGELTATGQRPGIAVGFPNRDGVEVLGDGTFAVEYDCATGAWEVFEDGVGSIGSGTLALPSGNLARIIYGASRAAPVVVKANFGNEAWVISPSSGFGGVPMPSVVIPVSWDDRATPYSIMRNGDGFTGNAYATRLRSPGHTFGTLGKSSGKWRVGILANKRIGLAVGSYDSAAGNLGDAGTANSVGYDVPTGMLHWCFGGVHQSVSAPVPVANYPHVVFALDMSNNEITFCYQDFNGETYPIYTVTGVPAGTWYPCESNSFSRHYLAYNPTGPIGFNNWAITV